MLDMLPQSLLSLEHYLKTELCTESIVPKGMLNSCVSIAEKKQNRGFRSGGGDGRKTLEIISLLL